MKLSIGPICHVVEVQGRVALLQILPGSGHAIHIAGRHAGLQLEVLSVQDKIEGAVHGEVFIAVNDRLHGDLEIGEDIRLNVKGLGFVQTTPALIF